MDSLTVKIPMTIKAKLTDKLRKKIVDELSNNIKQVDLELKQLELEEKKVISEQGVSNLQQLQAIRQHFSSERKKREEYKIEAEKNLSDTNKLAPGAEIIQGTLEHLVEMKVGDNIRELMNIEVLVEDDKIIAIRK